MWIGSALRMELYIVRHAIAVARGAQGVLNDRSRPLTQAGIEKMRQHAAALAKLEIVLDQVWTSPLVRAKQTAEILVEALGLALKPCVVKALEPGGDYQPLIAKLSEHADRAGIAIVGHEPDLGEFATYLLTGAHQSAIEFKKGAVACIELDDVESPPPRGRLRWLLTPKQLQMIA